MNQIYINDSNWYEFSPDSGLEYVSLSYNSKGIPIYKNKHIANFYPHVSAKVEVKDNDNIIPHVSFALEFASGDKSETLTLPLKGLGKVDWSNDVDQRCILNPDIPKAGEHIACIIRLQYAANTDTPEIMTVVDQLGGHRVEEITVFHKGDDLIWPSGLVEEDKPKIIFKPVPNTRLAVDPDCSEEQAVAGMRRIVDLNYEAGRILFTQMLLYVMRTAFVAAGIVPKVFVFLWGKTGNKKTTYAQWQTQLYNRDEPLQPLVRTDASIAAAVNLLYEKPDCVTVLDDLFKHKDKDIHRKQEQTLLELTRVIGDGIEPARMRGWKIAKNPPKCGVLAIGEYYIGSGSDGARHLPAHMTTPIDNDKMTACQEEPLMLSTFYSFFIKWYITNFDGVVSLIKEWLAVSRNTKTGVHARLQDTQFCMEAAYKLYLTYCQGKGFISQAASLNEYSSFYNQLRGIVLEQDTRANQHKVDVDIPMRQVNYLAIIRSMYREQRFKLADSANRFRRDVHDGVIHKDHLYFREDKLMAKIHMYEPEADFNDVIVDLKWRQALNTKGHSTSKQLYGVGSGLRFYVIRLDKLR